MKNIFFPLGGGDEIGASSYYLQLDGTRLLLDCGLRPYGKRVYPDFDLLYAAGYCDGLWELDSVFISHGHLDHSGALPKLVDEAPNIPVYTAAPGKQLIRLLLDDTVRKSADRRDANRDFNLQLFNSLTVERGIDSIAEKKWGETLDIGSCRVTFFPAGHILGASMIYIESDSVRVLFTGDYSHYKQFSVPAYNIPDDLQVDVLITETTYGYRNVYDRETVFEERLNFARQLEDIIDVGGTVLIPAFAVGRSQELALLVRELMLQGVLPSFPVYLDGMAKAACDIYENNDIDIFIGEVQKAPAQLIRNLDCFNGMVISSSGMLAEGSLSARYAERILPNARNALFFTGYLDEESPGGRLGRLRENTGSCFRMHGKNIPVRAEVHSFRLSAHTDSSGIFQLVEKLQPQKVIFVHGYPRYGSKVNILNDAYARYGFKMQFIQSSNGVPVYL